MLVGTPFIFYSTPIMAISIEEVFHRYLPPQAVNFCLSIYHKHPFTFKVTNKRETKLGDFRMFRNSSHRIITVNGDLNKYAFFITLIHEMAHMIAYERFGREIQPHGAEWKNTYQHLLTQSLQLDVYPHDMLEILLQHINTPKASTCADPRLYKALRVYDENYTSQIFLAEITEGNHFSYRKKYYKKIKKRRTRSLCECLTNGKRYLISDIAMVIPDPKEI